MSGYNIELGFTMLPPGWERPSYSTVFEFSCGVFCFLACDLLAGSAKKPPHSRPGSPVITQEVLQPLVNVRVCTTVQETQQGFSSSLGHMGEQCTNQAL